jgi:outer membrane protein assembly factor BamB
MLVRYGNGRDGQVIAVDRDTGRQRWRRPGWLAGQSGEPSGAPRVLIGSMPGVGDTQGLPQTIHSVDAATGETVWSYRPPRGGLVENVWRGSGGDTDMLITGLPSGRVEVRDALTGELLSAANLRPPVPMEGQSPSFQWLSLLDGMLMVVGTEPGTASAYGLPALDRKWNTPWSGGSPGWYAASGWRDQVMFVQSVDGRIRAMDRHTGRVRWSAEWSYLEAVGDLLLATRGDGPYGGPTDLTLIDPATGESRARLGTWALSGRAAGADMVVTRMDTGGTARAWVGILDPGTADIQVLGVARDLLGDCRVGRDCLVCRRRDDAIGIWRYR